MNKSPSDNQIKLADQIASVLNLDFPRGDFDFTSYCYWKFINEHIEEYKDVVKQTNMENIFDGDIYWGYDMGLWEY